MKPFALLVVVVLAVGVTACTDPKEVAKEKQKDLGYEIQKLMKEKQNVNGVYDGEYFIRKENEAELDAIVKKCTEVSEKYQFEKYLGKKYIGSCAIAVDDKTNLLSRRERNKILEIPGF
jgi:hypothetical protein